MNLNQNQRRLLYSLATAALLIAIAALWVPTSWQTLANQQGEWVGEQAAVTQIDFGVLKPLRLTWESSPNGFWLGFAAVRMFPLFLSVTLTVAAAVVARQTYRLSRPTHLTNG
jgi:hypothetical protein